MCMVYQIIHIQQLAKRLVSASISKRSEMKSKGVANA